jgi:hypothetical protein
MNMHPERVIELPRNMFDTEPKPDFAGQATVASCDNPAGNTWRHCLLEK